MSEKVKKWVKCAGVRAIKTVAQTAVATIGTTAVMGEVNWINGCIGILFIRYIIHSNKYCGTSRSKGV